jgi:predicted nuclease with RNAse H fold
MHVGEAPLGNGGSGWPYVGVDLTGGGRPSDIAALDESGNRVAFAQATADDEILMLLAELGARIVAVDSPMALPRGLCCLELSCACAPAVPLPGRSAERALAARGIPCFWTTKRSIIKGMVYRAIGLKARLEAAGIVVLEVYPYAVKRVLLGRALPKKHTAAGLAALVAGARCALPACAWPEGWTPGHDQLDALYCAITARLHALHQTEALGEPDEVPIIVPMPSA